MIERIFAKLQSRYGRLWQGQWPNSEMQAAAMAEWAEVLADLTDQELSDGFGNWLKSDQGGWPPTAPQYFKACRPPKISGSPDGTNADAYKRFPKSLPKPPGDPEVAKEYLAKCRAIVAKHSVPDVQFNPLPIPADEFAFKRGHDYEARLKAGLKSYKDLKA